MIKTYDEFINEKLTVADADGFMKKYLKAEKIRLPLISSDEKIGQITSEIKLMISKAFPNDDKTVTKLNAKMDAMDAKSINSVLNAIKKTIADVPSQDLIKVYKSIFRKYITDDGTDNSLQAPTA